MSDQKKVQMYFDPVLLTNLDAEVAKMGMNRSEFVRLAVEEKLSKNAAHQGMDTILPSLRSVVQDEIKSQFTRLAKMEAKTTKAAASGMYMLIAMMNHLNMDAEGFYAACEKKAVQYLTSKEI